MVLMASACGDSGEPAADPSPQDTLTNDPTTTQGSDGTLQASVGSRPGDEDDADGTDTTAKEAEEGDEGEGGDGSSGDGGESTDGFCNSATPTAIRFTAGGTSATIDAAASADQQDLYSIDVRADQIMTVGVGSSDPAAQATVVGPDGGTPTAGRQEQTLAPTDAGTYRICVAAGSAGADYRLTVSVIDDNTPTRVDAPWCGDTVNDRGAIRFAAGATSGSVDQAVIRGERDLYTFDAGAGQFLELLLVSLEDNAVFDLWSPSDELIIDEVSDFRIPLPEDGVYQICIGSIRGNASYQLTVDIS